MNIIGIVAEYNPFHLGHDYHIRATRAAEGEDCAIICAMSGDFVQRGEAAMYSKFARAEAACRSGADLVLELPLPWALSSAEGFARGAVGMLAAAGAEKLSFGSEAGETGPLEALAEILLSQDIIYKTKDILAADGNMSYAAARQRAVEAKAGDAAKLLEQPNNILAVEYLKAIRSLGVDMKPMTVRREGSGHDRDGGEGPKSAAEIRRMTARGEDVNAFLPGPAAAVYAAEQRKGRIIDAERTELAVMSRLRMLGEADFRLIPDAGNGVGERLYRAAHEETNLNAVMAAAKTKRYALSRIRRMCMCAALGVKAGMNSGVPPYMRVLAANERGCAVLRRIQDNASVPVITKPATAKMLSYECMDVFATGVYAHDLYVLGYRAEGERKGGEDWRISPIIVKNP